MKTASTIRRELKRLRGMRDRKNKTDEQDKLLWVTIATLSWVLEPKGTSWTRRSECIPGMDCRKGAP